MRRRQPESGRGPNIPRATTGARATRTEHALSSAFVRTVAQAGRYCDGQGLYLDVQPSGSRSWIQRIAIRGRELGVGGFPVVSLQEARAKALANRRLARAGGDPLAEKRRLQDCPHLRRGRRTGLDPAAARLAPCQAPPRLAHEPDALRLPVAG